MKNILVALLIVISFLNLAWTSESGSGVVSDNEVIVRTSLEATEVLKSGLLTQLYGVTEIGGTVNYASFDAGGVLSFINVVSSADVVKLNNNTYLVWKDTSGVYHRIGLSADDVFVLPPVNSTEYRVSGNSTITSSYVTGTCTLQFNNGLLTSATC